MFQPGYTVSHLYHRLPTRRGRFVVSQPHFLCIEKACSACVAWGEAARCATFPDMVRYIGKRLVSHLILLYVAVSLTYLLAASQLDPAALFALNQPPLPDAVVQAHLAQYNLSDQVPLLQRYLTWLSGVVQGNWGYSPAGVSVNEQLMVRAGVSLRLLVVGTVAGVVIGVAVGAWTASRQYRISDRVITALSLLVVSTPVFVIALLSQFLAIGANRASGLQIFEFSGETGAVGAYPWAEVVDRAQHLVLPTLVLTVAGAAWLSRVQRHLMLEALGADYVRTARAKGLRAGQAAWRHALRSALVPTSTYVTFSVASMLVGSTFVERIFGFPGLGSYVVEAIQGRDVNAVVAVTALAGACVMIGAVVSDLAVAALDPRVRLT